MNYFDAESPFWIFTHGAITRFQRQFSLNSFKWLQRYFPDKKSLHINFSFEKKKNYLGRWKRREIHLFLSLCVGKKIQNGGLEWSWPVERKISHKFLGVLTYLLVQIFLLLQWLILQLFRHIFKAHYYLF